MSGWRKIAIGTWLRSGDPSVYSLVEFNAEPALEHIARLRKESGQKITLSHYTGRAVALALSEHPALNSVLRWGRLYQRENVDVFFQVASDSMGEDLSGLVVRNADQKSVRQICEEMNAKVTAIKSKEDRSYRLMKSMMQKIPGGLTGFLLGITGRILYSLNLWSPLLATPRDAFGSVMITNIGSIGLNAALAPLVPFSRVPVLIALGGVEEKPVVENGKIIIQKRVTLGITLDHRVIDGVYGAKLYRTLKEVFTTPEKLDVVFGG